jgi:hypothetical protein
MKTKYTLFRRGEMFYMQDSATGKQTSLHTKDETEAKWPCIDLVDSVGVTHEAWFS